MDGKIVCDRHFSEEIGNEPMHYHVCDRHDAAVLEIEDGTCRVYEDECGILTNAPSYPEQLQRTDQYRKIGSFTDGAEIPADYSSTSRFVRGAWLRSAAVCDGDDAVACARAVIGAMTIPRGVVMREGKEHYTRYTAIIDKKVIGYEVHRYAHEGVMRVQMKKESLNNDSPSVYYF